MEKLAFKCLAIMYIPLLIQAYSVNVSEFEEYDPMDSNVSELSNFPEPLYNLTLPMSGLLPNVTYRTFTIPCYLYKEENGTVLTVNKSRAEVGNDSYTDYEEACSYGGYTPYLLPMTIESLAGK